MRLVHPEPDRSECRSEKCCVEGLLERLRQRAFVDHVLNREESGDVSFCLFEITVGLLQFLPDRGLTSVLRDVVRTKTVHQLVDEDVGEERVERDGLLIRLW